jgi:hypothetical protein
MPSFNRAPGAHLPVTTARRAFSAGEADLTGRRAESKPGRGRPPKPRLLS